MYRTGQRYKVETDDEIFYTGEITGQDETHIQLSTDRGEEVQVRRKDIKRSMRIQDRTGKDDGKGKHERIYS